MFNNQAINTLADCNTAPNDAIDALCTSGFLVFFGEGGQE